LKLLLVQFRAVGDPMIEHEIACVERKLAPRPVTLHTRNAVVEPAEVGWLDGFDALLLGGSGDYSVHHPKSESWVSALRTLLDSALQRSMPGLAICFGHQLLGLHLGGTVITSAEHTEVGTIALSLTSKGRSDPLFDRLEERFSAQTGHSDHVTSVPSGVDLLASSAAVETQAFRVRGTSFYSVQFHPDLTGAEGRQRYLECTPLNEGVSEAERQARAEQFRLESDEGSRLLGLFVELIR
jgi:GMP synthase (glutamine-hydrolysing)